MNDPQRLLDGGGDPVEAELLRSARGDAPPREGKARLLGAMGLAAAATTAAGAGTASGAMSSAMSGAKGVLAVAGKWMVLGGMGAAVAAGTVHVVRPSIARAPSPVVAPSQTPSVTKVATPSMHAPPSPRPVESAAPAIEPPAKPMPTPTPTPAPRVPAHASDDDVLAEELPYIDRARHALAKGEPADAIFALDTYELHFIHPRLAEEAQVLRIEALVRLGKTDLARSVADRFLHADPASPYAKRVQSLLRQGEAQ